MKVKFISGSRLESEEKEVIVREPDEELKRSRTYELLQRWEVISYLQSRSVKWNKIQSKIEEELLEVCESERNVYTPYIICVLARKLWQEDVNNIRRVLKLLDVCDVDGFSWRSEVVYRKAKLYEMVGESDKARSEIERLKREFPGSFRAWFVEGNPYWGERARVHW